MTLNCAIMASPEHQ